MIIGFVVVVKNNGLLKEMRINW